MLMLAVRSQTGHQTQKTDMKKLAQYVLRNETYLLKKLVCRGRWISHAAKMQNGDYVFVVHFHNTNRVTVLNVTSKCSIYNRFTFDHHAQAIAQFSKRCEVNLF